MLLEEGEKTAGQAVYAPLLERQLEEERSRKSSLEQRGVAVISTSGVLVSLLFGLAAVVTTAKGFDLPQAARVLLVATLVLFVLAAVGGILSNWPLGYHQVQTENLHRLISKENWIAPPGVAAWRIAEAQVSILERARKLNEVKARALLAAMTTQILAVTTLATAVAIILIETP
jgi:hypothetical protein